MNTVKEWHFLPPDESLEALHVLQSLAQHSRDISSAENTYCAIDLYRSGSAIRYVALWTNQPAPAVVWHLSDQGPVRIGLTSNDDIDRDVRRQSIVPNTPFAATLFTNSIDAAGSAILLPGHDCGLITHPNFWIVTAARVCDLSNEAQGPGNSCAIEFETLLTQPQGTSPQDWKAFCINWIGDLTQDQPQTPDRHA